MDGPTKAGMVPIKFGHWNVPLLRSENEISINYPFVRKEVVEKDDEKENENSAAARRRKWKDDMSPIVFGTVPKFSNPDYLYLTNNNQLPIKKIIRKRLAKEFATVQKILTCDPDASIWFRVEDGKDNMTKVRFMVSAPTGTPYSRGLWMFDMWVTDRYPLEPPKCKSRTTGNNKVRFNPNLYADGYVCLSILNTWQGAKSEMWGPHQTIAAICISIQSAVLGQEYPYFNEPGYERNFGNASYMKTAENYNKDRRHQTITWAMIDHMENPSPGFEEAIAYHFNFNKKAIMEQAIEWQKKDKFSVSILEKLRAAYKKIEPAKPTILPPADGGAQNEEKTLKDLLDKNVLTRGEFDLAEQIEAAESTAKQSDKDKTPVTA